MASLKQDIKTQSDWIILALKTDGFKLDYSIQSFIEIDRFFEKNTKDGKPTRGGRLAQNIGAIIFSIGSYIGEAFIKNVQGTDWITDDNDPNGEITAAIKFPDGNTVFPMQRVMNRFKNGYSDSIYTYGFEITKNYINEPFNVAFWDIGRKSNQEIKKAWWKFW